MKHVIRILFFGLTIFYWAWLVKQHFNSLAIFLCVIVAVATFYPVVWIGRRLLDARPTKAKMEQVTTGVHFVMLLFLGTAVLAAVVSADSWRGLILPIDRRISLVLMVVTGLVAFATVINLALRGWVLRLQLPSPAAWRWIGFTPGRAIPWFCPRCLLWSLSASGCNLLSLYYGSCFGLPPPSFSSSRFMKNASWKFVWENRIYNKTPFIWPRRPRRK